MKLSIPEKRVYISRKRFDFLLENAEILYNNFIKLYPDSCAEDWFYKYDPTIEIQLAHRAFDLVFYLKMVPFTTMEPLLCLSCNYVQMYAERILKEKLLFRTKQFLIYTEPYLRFEYLQKLKKEYNLDYIDK